jgi:hypothetical protein
MVPCCGYVRKGYHEKKKKRKEGVRRELEVVCRNKERARATQENFGFCPISSVELIRDC